MVARKSSGSSVRLSSEVASALIEQLDVELHAAHAREIVLARVEEHALEELGGGVERRRIAGAQLAVDFDQRFVLRLDRVLADGGRDHRAHIVALGEEDFELFDARLRSACRARWWSARCWRRSALRRWSYRPRRRPRTRLPDRWPRLPPAAILAFWISLNSEEVIFLPCPTTVSPPLVVMACESFRPVQALVARSRAASCL